MKEYCIQYIDQETSQDYLQACVAHAKSAKQAGEFFHKTAPLKRVTLITYLGKLDD